MKIDKRHLLNYSILIPYLILSILGLIVVYSTSSATLVQVGANSLRSVLNQGIFWVISLLAIALIYKIKLDFLKDNRLIVIVIFVEILLLILSRFLGARINGAHGWLRFGPISLQPAEYLKIILIWFLAQRFSHQQDEIATYDYQALTRNQLIPRALNDWRILVVVLIGIVAALPDLGNATILLLTTLIMVTVSGIGYRWFSTLLGILVTLSTAVLAGIWLIGVEKVAQVPVFGYVAKRFSAFFNPFKDLSGAGHQLANSYYAMSNGGWFGLGLGNSIEKRGYLPEAQTDFVFSIVIEEFGFIGSVFLIGVYIYLAYLGIMISRNVKNLYGKMVILGITFSIGLQTLVNIGTATGTIPPTGVTLPFVSYGGSSLVMTSVMIGIILSIARYDVKGR